MKLSTGLGFEEAVTSGRRLRRHSRREGFTLVELMVALALAAMISVGIMFISTTARETYSKTVARVEVYNRFRLALHTVQKDLSSWVPTMELEFYIDGRGGGGARRNFHWEPGEELPARRDERGPGVVDGGQRGKYDEFASILERYYESNERSQLAAGDDSYKVHDAYQVYFRAFTFVDGAMRQANVEYMLVDPSQPPSRWVNGVPPPPTRVEENDVKNLALYKIVRYFDIQPDAIQKLAAYPVRRRVLEVATNVTDFRVEYLAHNPFARGTAGTPRFVTPSDDHGRPVEPATQPRRIPIPGVPGGVGYRKFFGYGSVKLDEKYPLATAYAALFGDDGLTPPGHRPVRFGFPRNPNISFAELVPGDRIYVFTQSQRGGVGAQGGIGSANRLIAFPAGDYTVKANLQGMLEFAEDVDSSTWNSQDQAPIYYKAGYVPSALRVTLRMVDDDGINPKTMQQVIWLRRKSR